MKNGGRISKSTLALVNDEESPTYREAIFRRNGSVELPQERNVLTHLEAGDAVMPAKQTAMLLGLPQYKNGFGDWLDKAANFVGDVTGDIGDWLADKIDQLEDALKDPSSILMRIFKRARITPKLSGMTSVKVLANMYLNKLLTGSERHSKDSKEV